MAFLSIGLFAIRSHEERKYCGHGLKKFINPTERFAGLVWSPDSTRIAALLRRLAAGSGNEDQGLRVFSVVPGQNYEFDQSDYQVFGWINSEELSQQAKAAMARD